MISGIVQVEGLRTSKKFILKKPSNLLKNWISEYNITNKCKMWTYSSPYKRSELLTLLKQASYSKHLALALHSASDELNLKNTNLDTLELYILDPKVREKLEKDLELEPQEKGYEVLLIEPYYKGLVNESAKPFNLSSLLLTYLDLYHFPLRGIEQAEFIANRDPTLKRIYRKSV